VERPVGDTRCREIDYSPLPSQRRFHSSTARFKGFSGPIGSGKSQALCHEAIRLSYLNPGRQGLIGAPTYWNELNGPSTLNLGAALNASATTMSVSATVTVQVGDLVQIESEVLVVQAAVTSATACTVSRGAYGSTAAAHLIHTPVYLLLKKTYIMPFVNDFFGSLASGSYSYPVAIPDVRVGTAELFVTNDRGNSSVARECYTATTDLGIRTFSGGQLTIQIEGPLAIQTGAVPLLLMDNAHSVRDVYAVVKEAPTGTAITMQVTQNGNPYCELTIPVNTVISNDVDGFALGPLAEKAQIGLDITAVTATSGTSPGSDLTVTIRL
jgi:hypothetical protein